MGNSLRLRGGPLVSLSPSPLPSCKGNVCVGPRAAWRALTGQPLVLESTLGPDAAFLASMHSPLPRIITWNARALFSADVVKMRSKVETVRKLLQTCDILMVQETHGGTNCHSALDLDLTHHVFHSSHGHAWSAGGVLLLVRRDFACECDICFSEIVPGRVCAVSLSWHGVSRHFLTCQHGESFREWLVILHAIKSWYDGFALEFCCLVGDWNMILSQCDQLDIATGAETGVVSGRARAFKELFPSLVEVQAGFTRLGATSLSSLDRLFCNVPQGLLAVSGFHAQILGQCKPPSWSDHWPVHFHLQSSDHSAGDSKLPAWVAKSSCWSEVLRGVHLNLSEDQGHTWRE
eukprot:2982214-Amphidinium_carterae.1